ncbi:MAG: DUF423 domain-containing protein [Sphingobacteriales bacterium]|nr:MAG: DUF423 domain-containing protein [Sphingobacteriales bacterium]
MKIFFSAAAVFGFLGVAFGSFGAHSLKDRLEPYYLDIFKTGVQYQMYHALALLAVALFMKFQPSQANNLLNYAGWAFVIGIVIFSGSLYILSISGIKIFGAITPIGGLCFLAGWAMLFLYALKKV